MGKEGKRLIIYFVILIVSTIYLFVRYFVLTNVSDFHKETLVGLAVAGVTSSVVGFYEIINSYGHYFWKALNCSIFIPNKKVYVSLSYLLRIKLHGSEKYLLVRGSKIDQYQPVGGVYKLVGNKCIIKEWEAEPKSDKKNQKDLRFFVKAKYLPKIIKWFKSGEDREVGIWREFFEELVETKIVSKKNFSTINAEQIKTVDKLLIKENRFKDETYHTLIYNVYSVELNNKQTKELVKLMTSNPITNDYAFVTRDEIKKECFNNSKTRIGQHTKYII